MTRVEHLLWILSEECDEVGQRASKAARFGLSEIQPDQPLTNAQRIVREFYDLMGVMEMLEQEGFLHVNDAEAKELIAAKKAKVEKYLEYSEECGTLSPS